MKFISIADQEPLTERETARALLMAAKCRGYMESRGERIAELGLNPAIWNPTANWDSENLGPCYKAAFRIMRGEDLNYLRLLAQQFTGYALWALSGGAGKLPPEDPGSLNGSLLERALSPDETALQVCREFRAELPPYLHISPPAKFGEVGWLEDGVIVNYDTSAYWERMLILYRAGFLNRDHPLQLRPGSRVLEIGAGYGALAWYIQEATPGIDYTVLDLPESLVYSSIYLEVLHPAATRFLPNYEFPALVASGERFDLVINTLSMSEMSEAQVRVYCEGIQHLVREQGFFLEQNQDNRHLGLLNAQDIVQDYFAGKHSLGAPHTERHLSHGAANLWTHAKH